MNPPLLYQGTLGGTAASWEMCPQPLPAPGGAFLTRSSAAPVCTLRAGALGCTGRPCAGTDQQQLLVRVSLTGSRRPRVMTPAPAGARLAGAALGKGRTASATAVRLSPSFSLSQGHPAHCAEETGAPVVRVRLTASLRGPPLAGAPQGHLPVASRKAVLPQCRGYHVTWALSVLTEGLSGNPAIEMCPWHAF